MTIIYMDESGDLGFDLNKKRTTRNFIITFLFSSKPRLADKIVSKVFKSIDQKKRLKHSGTLHCSHEHPKIRWKMLNLVKEYKDDLAIMVIRLNKKKVYTKLQNEKVVLYNYTTNILLDRILNRKLMPDGKDMRLVASRRETNKFMNENFKNYLNSQISNKHKINLKPEIKTPSEEKGLQVVDFISWAIFQKYENNEESYYNTIKDLIVEDNPLFGG